METNKKEELTRLIPTLPVDGLIKRYEGINRSIGKLLSNLGKYKSTDSLSEFEHVSLLKFERDMIEDYLLGKMILEVTEEVSHE